MFFMDDSLNDGGGQVNRSLDAECNKELITEEDLIDTLFYTCDTEKNGEVHVSRLIEYLRHTTCNAVGSENEIEKLSHILDPTGVDIKVDLARFRNTISSWIECLKNKNDNVGNAHRRSPLKRRRIDTDLNSTSSSLGLIHPSEMASLSFNLIDAATEETSDCSEYKIQLADLHFQNKRLNDENYKLQQQMDQQDEHVANLNLDAMNLKKKIKSLQEIVDLRQDVQRENEDLKSIISSLQENSKHLKDKISMLEKESAYLEIQITDADYKILNLMSEVEMVRNQQQDNIKALKDEKDMNIELRDNKLLLETQLNEKNNEVHELQIYIKDLTKSNNELKERQSELQSSLTKAQHDLLCVKNDQVGPCDVSTLSDYDEDDFVMKNGGVSPVICTTPARSTSICSELRGMLDKNLPSPLCQKDIDETNDHADFEVMNLDFINTSTPILDLSKETSCVITRFRHRQDEMMKELASFVADKNINTPRSQFSQNSIVEKLKTELEKMTKKFSCLAKSKEVSDKRSLTLLTAINKLKDENSKFREMQEDTRQMLTTAEIELDASLDNRIVFLKDQLNQEKVEKVKLEDEFLSLKEDTKTMKKLMGSKDIEIQQLVQNKNQLAKEKSKFQSSNAALAEQCHKAELKVVELEEEALSAQEICSSQREKCKDLENAVQVSEKLLEKITREASFLQSELDKKEKVLDSLRKRSSILHPRHSSVKSSQTTCYSPLFDALTIDCYSRKVSLGLRQRTRLFSSSENLNSETDVHELFDDKLSFSPQQYYKHAKSYLEFGGKSAVKSSSTQTDIETMSSTSSSSSGIHELDNSSDSLISMSRRAKRRRVSKRTYDSVEKNEYGFNCASTNLNNAPVYLIQESKICDKFNDCGENSLLLPEYKRRHSYMAAIENDILQQEQYHSSDQSRTSQMSSEYSQTHKKHSFKEANFSIDVPVKVKIEHSQQVVDSSVTGADSTFVVVSSDTCSNAMSSSNIPLTTKPSVFAKDEKICNRIICDTVLLQENKDNGETSEACPSADLLSDMKKEEIIQHPNFKYSEKKPVMSPNELEETVSSKVQDSSQSQDSSLPAGSVSFLRKKRNENLAKRRENVKQQKMPELPEMTEHDTGVKNGVSDYLDLSVEDNSEQLLPSNNSSPGCAFPSITDELLLKLGLKNSSQMSSVDQLSDEEIEVKFNSLSLAFKTDNLTLKQRLEIQERSRNISEENVDKELQALRDALEVLEKLIPDHQLRDISNKIRGHLDVLANATARVSSRSEMFGAVQQEGRLGRAIEIMVNHVENLKRGYEREHAELEDIRKMLPDKNYADAGDFLSRRSASVCPGMANAPRLARRRGSEAALPRYNPSNADSLCLPDSLSRSAKEMSYSDDEDMRVRFSSGLKSSLGSTGRRTAFEKQTTLPATTVLSKSSDSESKTKDSKKGSGDEEAFQRGFEQGVRTHIGREISELRDQQSLLSSSLEEIMDQNEEEDDEETRTLKQAVTAKIHQTWLEVKSSGLSKSARMTMAGLVLLMAFCSAVLTFIPVGSTSIEVNPRYNHHGQPPL